ncbi:hypothetical protein BH20ACT22_BH20ACT22_05650 [soil metagenome]
MDLGLPGIEGREVIERLRAWSKLPVIVISVREGQEDKVAALDAGADDLVTKPFGMKELLARMRAVRRRATTQDGPHLFFGSTDLRSIFSRSSSSSTGNRFISPPPSTACSKRWQRTLENS